MVHTYYGNGSFCHGTERLKVSPTFFLISFFFVLVQRWVGQGLALCQGGFHPMDCYGCRISLDATPEMKQKLFTPFSFMCFCLFLCSLLTNKPLYDD